MPPSPPVYRRGLSREDGDVFSRLGAGVSDPTPGGSIKDFNGRVSVNLPSFPSKLIILPLRLDESGFTPDVYTNR